MTIQASASPTPAATSDRGGIREVAILAYPVVLSHLSSSAMQVADSAMVGRLGAAELGGVGFGGIWLWTALTLFIGTATGVQTFVAQADGAGRPQECGRWAWQGLWALVPITAIGIGMFALAYPTMVSWVSPSAELSRHASVYVQWRAFGCVGMAVQMVLSSYFRGLGDTKTPMWVAVGATVLNVALDYALIFGHFGLPAWGVKGAGVATALAESAAGLALLGFFLAHPLAFGGQRPLAPDRGLILRFLRTSLPIGGQWCIEMGAFAIFSGVVARMGDAPMAASQAMIAMLSLSFMQAIGISVASATLVGRYVGAGDLVAAARSHRSAVLLGLVLCALVATLLATGPTLLIRLFSTDPEVIRIGRQLLLVGAVFQIFDALQIISAGSLRGGGDTRWPFVVQSLLAWGFSLPAAWVGAVWFEGGAVGAWIGVSFYVAVLAAAMLRRFERGVWKEIRI